MSKFGEIAFTRFAILRSIEYGGDYRIARRALKMRGTGARLQDAKFTFLNSMDCGHCKKTEQFAADLLCYSRGYPSRSIIRNSEPGETEKGIQVQRTLNAR